MPRQKIQNQTFNDGVANIYSVGNIASWRYAERRAAAQSRLSTVQRAHGGYEPVLGGDADAGED